MKYKIKLIGFDSMGSRGMATVIEVMGQKIFIDPGVSYAPRRYGLPPHPIELECFEKHLESVHDEIIDSTHIIISHYHRDHYLYRNGEQEYYRGKELYLKDPVNNINVSQRVRAYTLLKKMGVESIAKNIHVADGRTYVVDDIRIEFSKPMPHGPEGTPLGYIVMAYIHTPDISLLHASDVQGPIYRGARDYIIGKDPDILIISGPPTYFEGCRIRSTDIRAAINNMIDIVRNTVNLKTIILDHHLLRDLNYRDKLRELYENPIVRDRGIRIVTAAEYMGEPVRQLEALRKRLWESSK